MRRSNPAQQLVLLFLAVILLGTVLLALPAASATGRSIGFVDALFTSTSATCVTGLIVKDTPNDFSTFGILVILGLIQVGGLGIMTFGYLIAALLGGRDGRMHLGAQTRLKEDLGVTSLGEVAGQLRMVATWVFFVETMGALLLLPLFLDEPGGPLAAIGHAFFFSISAFCNAGFSLRSTSLEPWAASWYTNLVIMGLIIIGGLGFAVLRNLTEVCAYQLRRRFRPEAAGNALHLTLHSRIVLWTSGLLVVVGAGLFLVSERGSSLAGLAVDQCGLRALFLSVTARTAGFNTIPIDSLSPAGIWLMILLMAIGASPGGTGGGLKTTTVAVLYASMRQQLRGGGPVVVGQRTVPEDTIRRCLALFFVFLVMWGSGSFLLMLTELRTLDQILFEVVSALGTVGLSMGITGTLSLPGKLIVAALMFAGRVGPMTLFLGLRAREAKGRVEYPKAMDLVIG